MTANRRSLLPLDDPNRFRDRGSGSQAAVTFFPGRVQQSQGRSICTGEAFGLVDVAASGSVYMEGGEVEFLDASGQSQVTVVGGKIYFLESAGTSTVNVFGGDIEFLTVIDAGMVRIFGTGFRIIDDCLTGSLADGKPICIRLKLASRLSLGLYPSSCADLMFAGDRVAGRFGVSTPPLWPRQRVG